MQATTAILEAVGLAAGYFALASWEANIRAVLARLTTVADGVQDETAAEILRGLGIDRAEGVCFAGPVLQ